MKMSSESIMKCILANDSRDNKKRILLKPIVGAADPLVNLESA